MQVCWYVLYMFIFLLLGFLVKIEKFQFVLALEKSLFSTTTSELMYFSYVNDQREHLLRRKCYAWRRCTFSIHTKFVFHVYAVAIIAGNAIMFRLINWKVERTANYRWPQVVIHSAEQRADQRCCHGRPSEVCWGVRRSRTERRPAAWKYANFYVDKELGDLANIFNCVQFTVVRRIA